MSRSVRDLFSLNLLAAFPVVDVFRRSAYRFDKHPSVEAFAKNAGLGFAIPYLHNGQMHYYVPDFLARLVDESQRHLILETKGVDPLEEVKSAAAERWVVAVNAERSYGRWQYAVAKKVADIDAIVRRAASDELLGGQ
jgi:type III restriction enzyme